MRRSGYENIVHAVTAFLIIFVNFQFGKGKCGATEHQYGCGSPSIQCLSKSKVKMFVMQFGNDVIEKAIEVLEYFV